MQGNPIISFIYFFFCKHIYALDMYRLFCFLSYVFLLYKTLTLQNTSCKTFLKMLYKYNSL